MTTIPKNPPLLLSLPGQTAIITGGANGIGASTVRLLHSLGCNVVIADLGISQPAAEELISSLPTPGPTSSSSATPTQTATAQQTTPPAARVIYIPTDILDWESMKNLFRETVGVFGKVDIVVANAGLMESKPFFDWEDVDEKGELRESVGAFKVLDVNLKGTMNTLRLALHTMRTNPLSAPTSSRGSIVLISSTSGYFGGTSVVSYISSKHGITGLLRSSQQVANKSSIRLNAVAPFFTPTHITSSYAAEWAKAGLMANTTDDVAWAVAQTAADESLKGACCLVAGKMMREIEGPLKGLTREWVGDDVADLMAKGGELFERLGGYPLPGVRS